MDGLYFLASVGVSLYSCYTSKNIVNFDDLSPYIEKFEKDGVVVIPNILSSDELDEVRKGLHKALLSHKVDPFNLKETSKNITSLSSTGGAGGVLDFFYYNFKLQLIENQKIFSIFKRLFKLWNNKSVNNSVENDVWSHPFGNFDDEIGYAYIDRVCYRLPESYNYSIHDQSNSINGGNSDVRGKKKRDRHLQRSLTPHLDCCPHKLFEEKTVLNAVKWRPIQAFVALTDCTTPNHGGFEACYGLHHDFNNWAHNRPADNVSRITTTTTTTTGEAPCKGDFTPIRPGLDVSVLEGMQHVSVPAGGLCLWDNRIPHANARFNHGEPREAIYVSILPAVSCNKRYAKEQLKALQQGIAPGDQWREKKKQMLSASNKVVIGTDYHYSFNPLARKLLLMESWY